MNAAPALLLLPEPADPLGTRLALALGLDPAPVGARTFPDGEVKVGLPREVVGRRLIVVQSIYEDGRESIHDRLCRLLFILATARDAGAAGATLVVPYLCYTRQDQRADPVDPLTLLHVARMMEAMGAGGVVAVEVHTPPALENAFRLPLIHLESAPLFVAELTPLLREEEVTVVSPDYGGMKRAERVRRGLEAGLGRKVEGAGVAKRRRASGEVDGESELFGEVRGRVALVVDDIVSTGATLQHAASACAKAGAKAVWAAVTHGLFAGEAAAVVAGSPIERLLVTDSLPVSPSVARAFGERLTVVGLAPLLAWGIRQLHGEWPPDGHPFGVAKTQT